MGREHIKKLVNMADILPLLDDIMNHRQEHFIVLSIDSGRRLIAKRVVFIVVRWTLLWLIRVMCMLGQ